MPGGAAPCPATRPHGASRSPAPLRARIVRAEGETAGSAGTRSTRHRDRQRGHRVRARRSATPRRASRSSPSTSTPRAADVQRPDARDRPARLRRGPPGEDPLRTAQHLAIVLDDHLASVPFINHQEAPDGIDGRGGAQIQGGLTPERARQIATILESGPLPATLEPVGRAMIGRPAARRRAARPVGSFTRPRSGARSSRARAASRAARACRRRARRSSGRARRRGRSGRP